MCIFLSLSLFISVAIDENSECKSYFSFQIQIRQVIDKEQTGKRIDGKLFFFMSDFWLKGNASEIDYQLHYVKKSFCLKVSILWNVKCEENIQVKTGKTG